MMRTVLLLLCALGLSIVASAAPAPTYDEIKAKLRDDHPRLFLTPETRSQIRERAAGSARTYFEALKKKVDAYPEAPQFGIDPAKGGIDENGKLFFKGEKADQDSAIYAVRSAGGSEALECAIVYLATGEQKYLEKARRFLGVAVEFMRFSEQQQMLPEWYNNTRLNALLTVDWLYDEIPAEERAAVFGTMLRTVEELEREKMKYFMLNADTGNYCNAGLFWFVGVAARGEGVDDERAERMAKLGYELYAKMMDHRDLTAEGSGVLTSICTAYSFGFYPWASFLFLHSLRSAAGIDATGIWNHMDHFTNYFDWMAIPDPTIPDGFRDFGWGDGDHRENILPCWMMYTHLAQALHFYPEQEKQIRQLIGRLPEPLRGLNITRYPFIPYLLTQPAPEPLPTETAGNPVLAEHFPSFGLTNMRSGVTPNDTYASIKAGAKFMTHQHYDELSFIIYKRGFQALDSGTRCQMPHKLVYYPQTIAHNTLLIRGLEREPLGQSWYPANAPRITEEVWNDGGQTRMCVTRSFGMTRSAWHAATGGDATNAYGAEKCSEAVRQFVYIRPDYFVIYDRVTSAQPEQGKFFLLHLQNEPEYRRGIWRGSVGNGALFLKSLLPENGSIQVIGGRDSEFKSNGRNWPTNPPGTPQWVQSSPTWLGRYRLEIAPPAPARKTRFLTVLQAADADAEEMVPVETIRDGEFDGVSFTTREGLACRVLFRRDGMIGGTITIHQDGKELVQAPLHPEFPVVKAEPARPNRPAPPSPAARTKGNEFARIDLFSHAGKVTVTEPGNVAILQQPQWLKGGNGNLMMFPAAEGVEEKGNCSFEVSADSGVLVKLLGPDYRTGGKRIPVNIRYTSVKINGVEHLKEPVTVWHDKAFFVQFPAKAGEKFMLETTYVRLPEAEAGTRP